MIAVVLSLILIVAPPCDGVMCYKCDHCNAVLRTWEKVNCSHTCVKRIITHKDAEPGKASTHI